MQGTAEVKSTFEHTITALHLKMKMMAAMRLHLDSISKAYIYFLLVNSLVVLSLLTSFS